MDKQEAIGYFEVQKDGCLASINWYETTPTSLFREKSLKELRYQLEMCNMVISALSDRGYKQGYKDGQEQALDEIDYWRKRIAEYEKFENYVKSVGLNEE
jgi:hypothetical protein